MKEECQSQHIWDGNSTMALRPHVHAILRAA